MTTIRVMHGDCLDILPTLSGLDACVCDPPYHLTSIVDRFGAENAAPAQFGKDGACARASRGFMGKQWDGGDVALRPETWRLVFGALKPGAHLIAFGGTRTFHRMACAIEDAGFEIRDTLCWLYGTGFPKNHDVSKGIDKVAGAEREVIGKDAAKAAKQTGKTGTAALGDFGGNSGDITTPATPEAQQWQGWGTALKPAFEPIIIARKPLSEKTVAANVLRHGTGAINIGACRVGSESRAFKSSAMPGGNGQRTYGGDGRDAENAIAYGEQSRNRPLTTVEGRWPANVLHDGSEEVEAAFAAFGESGPSRAAARGLQHSGRGGGLADIGANIKFGTNSVRGHDDAGGSASRFFAKCEFTPAELRLHYSGKAGADDRAWSKHPTVKPIALMRWLVRLITPPGGTVLDCFAGSGTTGEAARLGGFNAVLIEREAEYVADIHKRLGRASGADTPLFAGIA